MTHCSFCIFQGSRDNMSIIIIAFPSAPTVDPEAKRKDEELDSLLRQKVEGDEVPTFISKHITCKLIRALQFADLVKEHDNDIEFQKIFQRLCDEEINDLPTGGELYSK